MRNLQKIWGKILYKTNSNKIHWEKLISYFVVLSSLILFSIVKEIQNNQSKKQLDSAYRFTIGTTTNYHNNVRSSYTSVDFEFVYLGTVFKGTGHTQWLESNVQKIGGRYYVKFSPIDPTNMEILFNKPVPEKIFKAPDTAWLKIPD